MPTSVCSEMARTQMEPTINSEKQMTASARWLMRPRVTAQRSGATVAICKYRQVVQLFRGWAAGRCKSTLSDRPYEDSSRMKGNFHVRFLGECGRGNPPALTRPNRPQTVPKPSREPSQPGTVRDCIS